MLKVNVDMPQPYRAFVRDSEVASFNGLTLTIG